MNIFQATYQGRWTKVKVSDYDGAMRTNWVIIKEHLENQGVRFLSNPALDLTSTLEEVGIRQWYGMYNRNDKSTEFGFLIPNV